MSCEYSRLDGAYVLGSLAPGERQDFERHLLGCDECGRAVRELAGLPGLLAHVAADDLEPGDVAPLPPTILPALIREARAAQRRRTVLVGVAAACLAAAVVGGLSVGGVLDGGDRTAAPATSAGAIPSGRPMEAVGASPVRADLLVSGVAWGTRLDLTCSYAPEEEEYEASPGAAYALVVTTRDGRTERVATWQGLPGRTMHLTAATATPRVDITSVEMRTADGVVVLRLPT